MLSDFLRNFLRHKDTPELIGVAACEREPESGPSELIKRKDVKKFGQKV